MGVASRGTRLSKSTVVDHSAITTPVLAIWGERSHRAGRGAVRQAATRYRHGTSVEIAGSDHMVFSGAALPVTMGHIDDWMLRNRLFSGVGRALDVNPPSFVPVSGGRDAPRRT